MKRVINNRAISVAACAFLFAYLLTFVFEGRVFYSLLDYFNAASGGYVLIPIAAHLAGLLLSGFAARSLRAARRVMCVSMSVCLAATMPFFFAPSVLWLIGLAAAGLASGCAFASWGYYLKACTPRNERIKSCADVLIVSNLIMIGINVTALKCSARVGLALSMLCLALALALTGLLPREAAAQARVEGAGQRGANIKRPLLLLFVFVAVITINSGLMYQVINPAFAHLASLTSWYWAAPYIAALLVMRSLPARANRSALLYVAMAMIMGAFICFMLMGRDAPAYVAVDTLMLAACGIFDLFWWSIIAEMLEYSDNPAMISGIGLGANVFGVLCGDILGLWMSSAALPQGVITVIALCVVCVTLVILPPLNALLLSLLKSHAYLWEYSSLSPARKTQVIERAKAPEPLTQRENEVLELVLCGRSNRDIAGALCISENTVKTHVRNIYAKYGVQGRAQLISALLKDRAQP